MARVIYFSGPDGAGKTTSFLESVKMLEQSGKSVFQLRTMQVARLKIIFRNKNKQVDNLYKTTNNSLGNVGRIGYSGLSRNRGKGFFFILRRYFGLIAALADIVSFGRFFVFFSLRKYDVILVEECPFDVFAKRHRPFFSNTAKLLKWVIPVPDLLVLCMADANEIVRRKPELTESEILNYYDDLSKEYEPKAKKPIYNHDTNSQESLDKSYKERIIKARE